MKKIPWLSAGFIFCVSCQTIDIADQKYACTQVDWFEIGRSDGVQGLDSLSYKTKQKDCEGFTESNHESYVNGWYAGVDEFCSPGHGFAFGRSGHKYLNVCPTAKEESFLASYRKGLKVFNYEKDNKQISEEIQKISKASEGKGPNTSELLKRMNELETRLELNKALISEIQREMDDSLSQPAVF